MTDKEYEERQEAAFRKWQGENYAVLKERCPATIGHNGAANNFDWWCRQVYTGRIKI